MILLCCASELGLPEDLSAIEVILLLLLLNACSKLPKQVVVVQYFPTPRDSTCIVQCFPFKLMYMHGNKNLSSISLSSKQGSFNFTSR